MKKSTSPTVRALDELKVFHKNEIDNLDSVECKRLQEKLNTIRIKTEKESTEAVVRAIEALHIPYKLEHKSLCNIRKWDGHLSFELKFSAAGNKDAAMLSQQQSKIIERRRNAEADLQQWYIKSLYDIAGRSNVTEFKVKR